VSITDAIERYDEAWNADASSREQLLSMSLADECELIEPRGRFTGRDAILERIEGFATRFPGARVDITTDVDEHNGVARYGWRIRDVDGGVVLEGTDVVDVDAAGRLRRIVMFFGPLTERDG
jgi:hypothetical protein